MITTSQLESLYVDQYPVQTGFNKLNEKLWKEILKTNPESVFEFGCNCGKNLFHLQKNKPDLEVFGCDISQRAIDASLVKGLYVGGVDQLEMRADIMFSPPSHKYSIGFTCSVLCHMNNAEMNRAVDALKKMSKRVILCETTELRDWNYVAHDYEALGFKKKWSAKSTPGNECTYSLYEWQ